MVKILYIEDNDDNIYVVSRRLQRKGYEVLIARDGAEGLAQAKSRAPALILVDLGLPVIDGWEVTRQLRVAPETRLSPLLHCLPMLCRRIASEHSRRGAMISLRNRSIFRA